MSEPSITLGEARAAAREVEAAISEALEVFWKKTGLQPRGVELSRVDATDDSGRPRFLLTGARVVLDL